MTILFWLLATAVLGFSQENNAPVIINGESMIIGTTSYANVLKHFEEWQAIADTVTLDSHLVSQFQAMTTPVTVLLFIGTWCPDSRHGVPPFMAVYQAARNPHIQLKIIGVTRDKEDPEGLASRYHIERVPTFVILANNKEIGRLVEFPRTTFAQDFIELLTNNHK